MANRRIRQNSASDSSGDDFDDCTSLKSRSLGVDLKSSDYLKCSNNNSLTCHDIGYLREVVGVHPECDLRIPDLGDDCHSPPLGYFTVFLEFFNSGLLFPPQPFLLELVKSLGVGFSQLTPNAIIVYSAFCHKITEIQMPLNVELFHSLFLACRSRVDSHVYFQPRKNCKFLSRIPSPKSFWKSQFFFIQDCGWEVPVLWSSGLRVIAMREIHHSFQIQCSALGLFSDLFDPRSLLAPGSRIDLASVRARKTMVERRSPFAGNNRALADRGAHISRDPVRRGVPSGRLENARGSEPQAHKKTITSSSTKALDSRFANGEGGESRKRVSEEVPMKTGEEELRHPKKSHVEDLGATSKNSKSIFVDGVNHKEKADSFWDLNDPEIGWKKGRSIVGDFDMVHLMSQSTDSFAHSLAWNSCQGLSLASAMRVREEKLRNDQNKLREEIVRLKEDNCRLVEEKKKTNVELLQAQIKFADKVKDFVVLEEKHSIELKTGGLFLGSETGKIFLKSVEDKSVQTFKASAAFREDVLDQAMAIHDDVVLDCRRQLRKSGVSEDIVMLIEPSVLEVDKVSVDDIPLGDAEMIEALIPRSVDDEA